MTSAGSDLTLSSQWLAVPGASAAAAAKAADERHRYGSAGGGSIALAPPVAPPLAEINSNKVVGGDNNGTIYNGDVDNSEATATLEFRLVAVKTDHGGAPAAP